MECIDHMRRPHDAMAHIAVLAIAAELMATQTQSIIGERVVPQGWSGKVVPCGRNDQCPCKSGKKYKKCHGNRVYVPPTKPEANAK